MAYIDETGLAEVTTKLKTYIDNKAGGGGDIPVEKDVNFYDYDGTLVAGYSKADFLALTEMPANPSHTGLVAQGWNWTLADAKTYVTDYGVLDIGQMYKTSSGLTEFDIELTKATGLTITFAMIGAVNWGDGTSEIVSASTTHTYSDYGKYTITCDGIEIPANISGASSATYHILNVRIGENVTTIYGSAFYLCRNLTTITIPTSVGNMANYVFFNCISLVSIIIPNSISYLAEHIFDDCYHLSIVSLPKNAYISSYAFYNCYTLKRIIMPSTALFNVIGNYMLYNCYSLAKVIIPNTIAFMHEYAFTSNFFTKLYDFTHHTSVPTLSNTNAFNNINRLCKIVVPDSLYSQWITASNWVTYADYIYKASEVTV